MHLPVTLKLVVIVSCSYHIAAGFEHLRIDEEGNDDIHVLANILKSYIISFHGDNGRFIMIRYLASDIKEFYRQTDLVGSLISNSQDFDFTFMIVDFKRFYEFNCHDIGLVINLFDTPK